MGTDSATRLYASSIAIVSGLYSIGSAAGTMMSTPMMTDAALGIGGWIMLGLGIIVLAHGSVLLTPAADRLGQRSGPLMVLWAVPAGLRQAPYGALAPPSAAVSQAAAESSHGPGWCQATPGGVPPPRR